MGDALGSSTAGLVFSNRAAAAPGSATAAAGSRLLVGRPWAGGERRDEEAQAAEEAAEQAATVMVSLIRTLRSRQRCHADAPPPSQPTSIS